jgi:DNA polymerase V
MYRIQKKEKRMSYPGLRQDNNEIKSIPHRNRNRGFLKSLPSNGLPTADALRDFLPTKNLRKPNLDSSCLRAFGSLKFGKLMDLPYFEHSVSAGYPTNTEDPFTRHLDISRYLMTYPRTTYYYKASGYSMVDAGINHGDLLVVDTDLKPKHRDIVIAVLNGEFTVKRFYSKSSEIKLLSANPEHPSITVTKEMDFFVQGGCHYRYSYV